MATSRVAIGSVLATISDTANAVSSIVNTTTKSIGMLDALVTKASNEQRKRHIVDSLNFDQRLAHEHAQEVSNLTKTADEFVAQHPQYKEQYSSAYANVLSLLNPDQPASQS